MTLFLFAVIITMFPLSFNFPLLDQLSRTLLYIVYFFTFLCMFADIFFQISKNPRISIVTLTVLET